MNELKAKFLGKLQRTESVASFRFSLPQKLDFKPGQFLQVIFDEHNRENKELNKYLSFSSSPTKDYIEVTKRISDSKFSQKLISLKVGDEVLIKFPLGECVFKEEYKKIGFLIGGIGITPVISILGYIVDKKIDSDVYLFYSNRTEEDIPFKQELDNWREKNKNIKVFYTVTECQPKDKTCHFGYINKEFLQEKFSYLYERIIFIFGPPKMVDVMYNITLQLECKKENIKTEKFIGY